MNLSRKTKKLGRDPVGTPRWQNALAAPANALAVLFFG